MSSSGKLNFFSMVLHCAKVFSDVQMKVFATLSATRVSGKRR
jgi:hypothetical protein